MEHADVTIGECRSPGGRIVTLTTTPRGPRPPHGYVVVPPGYERRIHHDSVLAWSLALNGFASIRLDLTNHVGISDGDVEDMTMTSMAGDVGAVLARARAHAAGAPLLLVAPSLGARAAIRSVASGASVDGAVLLLPDVERTITAAVGYDPAARWRSGEVTDPEEKHRVVEHEVKYACARDVVDARWGGAAVTAAELARIQAPVLTIAAERDDWVRVEDVEEAMGASSRASRRLAILEASSHDLAHNPPVMRLVLETALAELRAMAGVSAAPAVLPDFQQAIDILSTERAWARSRYADIDFIDERKAA